MNIALASCSILRGGEIDDDTLIESLQDKGVDVHRPAWTDEVDWNQFDVTIIRTTWDYHLKFDAYLDWVQRVPRLYNNAKTILWNANKSYLKEMESNGAIIAPTVWVPKQTQCHLNNIMSEFGVTQGFIKPQVGACASDTFRFTVDEIEQAQAFLDERRSMEMMIQPYIKSVETIGEFSAIYIAGAYSHGVQKIPVEGDYRVQDDFGASDMPYAFSNDEIDCMNRMLSLVPDSESLLYARFDFLKDEDGTLLLNELELIEPSMFFRHCEVSSHLFADAIINVAKNQL